MDKTRVYLTESLSTKERKNSTSVSALGIILNLLGYLAIICGFSVGAYMAFASKGIGIITLILVCLGSLITGLLIIGFAKMIYLLQEINNNLKN